MILGVAFALAQSGDPYARLAAALPEREWTAVRAYLDGEAPKELPRYVSPDASPLDAARAIVRQHAFLLDSLRRLTDATEPHDEREADPAAALRFEAFIASTAHVGFADGQRHEAVTLLLDGLTMARRLDDDAAQTLISDAIRRDKDSIPLAECDRVRRAADAWLATRLGEAPSRELALVRLRMRVEAYRWRYGKPPDRLVDAAPAAEILDPGRKVAFGYERIGDDYRLGEAPPAPTEGVAPAVGHPVHLATELPFRPPLAGTVNGGREASGNGGSETQNGTR